MLNCKTCPALVGFVKYGIEVAEFVTLWRYFDHRRYFDQRCSRNLYPAHKSTKRSLLCNRPYLPKQLDKSSVSIRN